MENIIGTCSECGGPVCMPMMSTRPVARCMGCGASVKHAYGPVIPMNPRPRPDPPWMREDRELKELLNRNAKVSP